MRISVIGLGKLGAPLAAALASRGHDVIGVDLNPAYVRLLSEGKAPVDEPQVQELIDAGRSRLRATSSFPQAVKDSELSIIIVPTPSSADGAFSKAIVPPRRKKISHCRSTASHSSPRMANRRGSILTGSRSTRSAAISTTMP